MVTDHDLPPVPDRLSKLEAEFVEFKRGTAAQGRTSDEDARIMAEAKQYVREVGQRLRRHS